MEELARLVAIPSVHDGHHVEACSAAADLVAELFADAGVADVRRVPTDDGSDAVVGYSPGPEGAPTVLLYSHYDVQPVDPDEWTSSPWELTERDGRLYGRGSADCKGNLVMLLTALRSLPRPWPVGVRIVCEGSEEMSTGGLSRLVAAEPELFAADVMVIADAGNVELGTPTVTTSLRGTGSVLVTVRTMAGPGHSGIYGGAAPDALAALIAVLASLARRGRRHDDRRPGQHRDLDRRGVPGRPVRRRRPGPRRRRACSAAAPSPTRSGRGRPRPCSRSTRRRCRT